MDPGLSPRWLSRLFVVLAVLFTALLAAGGFAFVGSTENVYQTVYVRNKVVPATRENYVDFRKHISPDGRRVSAEFLLLCTLSCTRKGFKRLTKYVRTNDVHNLNHFQSPDLEGFSNSTCVQSANGFMDEILETAQYGLPVYRTDDCKSLIFAEMVRQQQMKHLVAPAHNGSCPYNNLQIRCSNRSGVQCVASARVQDEFDGFVLIQMSIEQTTFRINYSPERWREREHPQVLESLTFMLQFLPQDALLLRTCAASRVQQNASVQKLVGERNVTTVNVALIMGALGIATALLVAVGTVALAMWVGVVWLKGRRRYNTFSAKEDALACAAQALLWRSDGGADRAEEGVVVRGLHGISLTCQA
ncbi:hypothetical protein FGB62_27g20 [Gracilaria domingensis]|nr:hypothetical protein FGB62_27g20 [Gracilaria domingensis]